MPEVRLDFLEMWDSSCQELCSVNYGVVPLPDQLNQQCLLGDADKYNKIWIPTQLSSCDEFSDNFVCKENFYFSETLETCVACSLVKDKCSIGFYHQRCQQGELVCHPCPNPILNASSQIYGEYTGPVPSCTTLKRGEQFSMDADGNPSCIPFLTPWWDEYTCPLRCQYNYINIGRPGAAECVPCYENQRCRPGQRCGGVEAVDDRECYSCGDLPGPHLQWLPDTDVFTSCRVGCADGFYDIDKTETVNCRACPESQKCVDSSQIFFGCHGENIGSCREPTEECTLGQTFLHYQISASYTECRNCSVPVLGSTFQVSGCLVTKDAVLQVCSKSCPVGYFKTQNCSLYSDIQCQKCSNAVEKKGFLMVEGGCNGEKDYVFVACPDGYACDGSPVPKTCSQPKRAQNGLCVCPPNTFLRDNVCVMVQCASGFYPHPETGVCIACSLSLQHAISLDGLWGKEACACSEGYFIERLNQTSPVIRCWPCGDLTCLAGAEYQTPCSGGSTVEPSCQCKLPPGVSSKGCQIVGCEMGLRQGPSFSFFATAKPQLWNSSFWVTEKQERHARTILATDFAKITSIAVIDEGTVVYIVNHVSLRIISRVNASAAWQSGTIENRLFIRGNRASPLHALVDMSVCKDSARGRFWLSFVMLTTECGDFSGMNNELRTCSNFELMQIKNRQEYTSTGCVHIVGTGLCAENMFLIWGKTISEGIPLLRIFSMHLNFVASSGENTLYLAMGSEGSNNASAIYAYSVKYHSPDTPFKDRSNDVILPLAAAAVDLSHLLWIENHFFGLAGGFLVHLAVRKPNHKVAGINKILKFFERIPLTAITQGEDKPLLVALSGGAAPIVYEADLWNGWVLPRASPQRPIFFFASYGMTLSVHVVQNATVGSWVSGFRPCPMDELAIHGQCMLQPCLLLDGACGPHSSRHVGQRVCSCLPGYYLPAQEAVCQLCPADHFCNTDRAEPIRCTTNARSNPGSSSRLQCFCAQGYYMQEDLCVPCPMGFWCLGKQYPPVQCAQGSSTQYMGSSSPVACGCQARTYDIDCKPCASSHLCLLLAPNKQPKVAAVYLHGSGPLDAERSLNRTCLTWGVSIVYQVPPSLATGRSAAQGKIWTWVVVTEPLPNEVDESGLVQNLSSCMVSANFLLDEAFVYTPVVTTSNVQRSLPCSLNYEWSGDVRTQECICIGGYETAKDKNLFDFCSPCKVGTMRPRMSRQKCGACADNHSHAPWLGMDHCVCKDGFFRDPVTKTCVRLSAAFASYELLASPFLIIPLSLALMILCMLCVWFVSLTT